jgi:hypothetical protein
LVGTRRPDAARKNNDMAITRDRGATRFDTVHLFQKMTQFGANCVTVYTRFCIQNDGVLQNKIGNVV